MLSSGTTNERRPRVSRADRRAPRPAPDGEGLRQRAVRSRRGRRRRNLLLVLVEHPLHQPLLHDLGRASPNVPAPPDRPQLKPWYRLAREDGRLVLEYGGKALVLEGE